MSAVGLSMDSKCQTLFKLDQKFHHEIRNIMRTVEKEHGGDTILDFDNGVILKASVQKGDYDRVDLRRGVIDWHTHPGKCIHSGKTCTIGLPSPADMGNVVTGIGYGTLAHMIFSREGTYVVMMSRSKRQRIMRDSMYRLRCVNDALIGFGSIYKHIERTPHQSHAYRSKKKVPISYTSFKVQFMAVARDQGFIVMFFEGNTIPEFVVDHHCSALSGGPGLSWTVL
jgi:hypothetical protein